MNIESRSYVVYTFASHSEGPGLDSRLKGWIEWLRFLVVFFSSTIQILGRYLKVGHNHFLPQHL
jgi:hypothetical protein